MDDSAISCAALLTLEMGAGPKSQTVSGMQLDEDYARRIAASNGAGPEQACFNKLFLDYKAHDEMDLDAGKTRAFAKAFQARCVKARVK
jgi:hypothetical protein